MKRQKVPSLQIHTRPNSRADLTHTSPPQTLRATLLTPRINLYTPRPQSAAKKVAKKDFVISDKPINYLKKSNQEARREVDPKVFWAQVLDYHAQRIYAKPEDFNQEKKQALYQKIIEEKQLLEQKRQREREAEEARKQELQLKLQLERELQEAEEQKAEEQRRIREMLAEKFKHERRFTFFNIVNAVMFRQLHSKMGAFKLSKLLSKHYLNLLNYKAIERRIKDASHAPLLLDLKGSVKPMKQAIQIAQIKEIQTKLNEGLVLKRKQTLLAQNQPGRKIREVIKAAEHFSPAVLKRIRFLQSCLRLKVFRTNRKSEQRPVNQGKKRITNRIRAQKKILDDLNFQTLSSPKSSKNISSQMATSPERNNKQTSPLGLFSTVSKAAALLKNYHRVKSEKLIKRTNELLIRQVQFLYYPMIRYISLFYSNVVVWSISYQDITLDKTCIVLFFKGEGRNKYFYRLDVPIGRLEQLNHDQKAITVWPMVRDYLISYLSLKGQLALLDESYVATANKYRLGFIQGLSVRSRRRITQEDIEAIVKTKSLLNYLQTSQLVRNRKIFGSVYELLRQFKSYEDDDQRHYIINLPMVHNIILNLRRRELLLRRSNRTLESTSQEEERGYQEFIENNIELLNQILCFRFIHNNTDFFKDQMLQTMYQLNDKTIFLQSALINISDIIGNYDYYICQETSKYCLFSLNISMVCQHYIDSLLFEVDSKEPKIADSQAPDLIHFNREKNAIKFHLKNFQIMVMVTLFEKDLASVEYEGDEVMQDVAFKKKERQFQPYLMSITNFKRLAQVLQETLLQCNDQKCDFHATLKAILLEQFIFSELFDLVLRHAFTLDFKQNSIQLKQKYHHLISGTHNFIQKMDHQSLYNKSEQTQKYSVFPSEERYLRKLTSLKSDEKFLVQEQHFTQFFSAINQIEVKLSQDTKHIEIINDYISETQEQVFDQGTRSTHYTPRKYFSHKNYLFIMKEASMKLIIKRTFLPPLVINIHNQDIIQEVAHCSQLMVYQQTNKLTGILRNVADQTSFLEQKNKPYLLRQKAQIPNLSLIKYMLISNARELSSYLDKLDFIFTLELNNQTKCYTKVKVYYHAVGKQTREDEKIYFFDGENLYISLELFEYSSKLKKYTILFNRFDLEGFFKLERYFTPFMVYEWCKNIVVNCRFDKRFLYTIPFSIMHLPSLSSTPSSPVKNFFRNFNTQKCIVNDFLKYNFDVNLNERRFLNSMHKIFRIIAHFVDKLYMVILQNNKKLLLNEVQYKQCKSVKQLIRYDFVIISVMSHTVLDQFQLIYYFPKSKRKMMANINILQFQEMDFKDSVIMDLLDYEQYSSYSDLSNYVSGQSKGQVLRKQIQLDSNVLNRLKFMKKKQNDNSPLSLVNIPEKQELAKLSTELLTKNKVIKQQISQNLEISQKVIKFLQFTRQISWFNLPQQKERFKEIKVWKLLFNQVFQLELYTQEHGKSYKQQKSVLDRLLDLLDCQQLNKVKIIGKEYAMKREQVENVQFHYKVQNQLTDHYISLIKKNQISITSPFLREKQATYHLRINYQVQQIAEFICSIQFKVERLGTGYVECFLEGSHQSGIQAPQVPIPYSSSFNYNIYFRYYSLNNYAFKDVRLNLRELLNLFIADGFFKSQTNYMNSKLSMADILTMCHYLTHKIKSQNFLNLSQLGAQKQKHGQNDLNQYIISQHQEREAEEGGFRGEGIVYSTVLERSKVVLQLQLFMSSNKVVLNIWDSKSDRFSQKDLKFGYINSHYVPFFLALLKAQRFYSALERLARAIKERVRQQK